MRFPADTFSTWWVKKWRRRKCFLWFQTQLGAYSLTHVSEHRLNKQTKLTLVTQTFSTQTSPTWLNNCCNTIRAEMQRRDRPERNQTWAAITGTFSIGAFRRSFSGWKQTNTQRKSCRRAALPSLQLRAWTYEEKLLRYKKASKWPQKANIYCFFILLQHFDHLKFQKSGLKGQDVIQTSGFK